MRKLGLRLDSAADFDLQIKIKAANGSYIDSHALHRPSIIFKPGEGKDHFSPCLTVCLLSLSLVCLIVYLYYIS